MHAERVVLGISLARARCPSRQFPKQVRPTGIHGIPGSRAAQVRRGLRPLEPLASPWLPEGAAPGLLALLTGGTVSDEQAAAPRPDHEWHCGAREAAQLPEQAWPC